MDLNGFFAMIFEFGGLMYIKDFSDEIFAADLYTSIGLFTSIISFFLVLTFYFIINRPSFSLWQHWLIVLLANFVISFIIGFILPTNNFNSVGIDFLPGVQYWTFALFTAIISTLFFVIWTYCFKWWYGDARGTPKIFFGKF